MNIIQKRPVASLGYDFIPKSFLPLHKDEYYLRNQQNKSGIQYRKLLAFEIELLVRNRNTSDDWNKILVSDAFNPELVKNCKFFGLIRIGKLESYYLEFKNLRLPVGLYNSTIISCDLGDNIVINNVHYISHYIVGNEVMLVNVNEVATTNYAKFGNGMVKEGEEEKGRIWLEVCNENAGRSIIPFDGMLPGDAYLWTRFRENRLLQNRLTEFTEKLFDKKRGYYGHIGDRTVIKNTAIIKDVLIGTDAYIKGANKLKNLTINSSAEAQTQIGEGVELVNGIIGYGCRLFYGVKAVRFIMASHSQLKYGARLINSYLGNNATISCCEVLNSLIFPAHEQHHNNSFLCAALLMGQSNMAAGATIGSNHNSRSADGELVAGRGFWPGLCVSLKHNSKFASFTLLSKGDYPAELNIPVPFSLVSNDIKNDRLLVMPGYWFFYNMYALCRNAWKYTDRDQRTEKVQMIEYDFLAPDSINEIVHSLQLFKTLVGKAWYNTFHPAKEVSEKKWTSKGQSLLEAKDKVIDELEIVTPGFENANRKTVITKVCACYHLFKELVDYHAGKLLIDFLVAHEAFSIDLFPGLLPSKPLLEEWQNLGGQLVETRQVEKLIKRIELGHVKEWKQVHEFYAAQGKQYLFRKLLHAFAAAQQVNKVNIKTQPVAALKELLRKTIKTKEWMTKEIEKSREKDYRNPFRQMLYENKEEMDMVTGSLTNNSFIRQEKESLKYYKEKADGLMKALESHAYELVAV